LNSLRFLHLLTGQAALVAGLIGSLPFFTQAGPLDLAALLLVFFGLLNLQRFGSLRLPAGTIARALLIAASALLLIATLAPLAAFLITPQAAGLVVYAVGVAIVAVCVAAVIDMLGWLPRGIARQKAANAEDGAREAGTVKWFNTTKGFGFISRDQGDDIFVHFRGIRGDGHRVLLEGQRVEFAVVDREKGPQAEDVVILD
jgi:cold shock protein